MFDALESYKFTLLNLAQLLRSPFPSIHPIHLVTRRHLRILCEKRVGLCRRNPRFGYSKVLASDESVRPVLSNCI
jgi:hypothetical protein